MCLIPHLYSLINNDGAMKPLEVLKQQNVWRRIKGLIYIR